jgi:hypothetical protein
MERTVSRAGLLAYLIGSGVAGTLLIAPYTGRSVVMFLSPDAASLVYVPFFIMPIAWGSWNWLRLRLRPRLAIGTWGALLGFVLAVAVNLLLLAEHHWFDGVILLPLALPFVYGVVWRLIVGPLNRALGVETYAAPPP